MVARILVVEDEPAVQELVAVNLIRAGHEVQRAGTGEDAQRLLRQGLPDLVLVDWGLPGMSGIEFMRWLRANARTRGLPLILVTARCQERDKIMGLEAGADDYVTKPFSPRELLARIAAVLRRLAPQVTYEVVQVGGLRLEPATRCVRTAQAEIVLGQTEFRLLHFLMAHPDRVFSRSQLLDQVWGDHFLGDERTVDVTVRRLRAALQPSGMDGTVRTVRGTGYCLSPVADAQG